MSTTSSRLSWVGDILLVRAFQPLLTNEGTRRLHSSLVWAGVLGAIEGVGLFAVIPTFTAFVAGQPRWALPGGAGCGCSLLWPLPGLWCRTFSRARGIYAR